MRYSPPCRATTRPGRQTARFPTPSRGAIDTARKSVCHDYFDLRLQSHDAAAARGIGPGARRNADTALHLVPPRSRRIPGGHPRRPGRGRRLYPGKTPVRRAGRRHARRGVAGALRQHPRDRRLEPRRRPGHAQAGRLAGGRAPARTRSGRHRDVQERRPPADHRLAGPGRAGRGLAGRRARCHVVRPGAGPRGRRPGAPLPRAERTHRQPAGLAGRVRVALDPRQPDRPGPVHALQRLY
ncbi:Uncharacterised protein [Bordetella pertussis]|nr:Uncharacterised protein [Bordetella pertussis]CFM19758.1 Uncharacterised protein [Bordetella pertussis]CFM47836.1 Uncharacterised protein [Bordetella pertussis]CFN04126.1 Uncharacterised protein [Bordetella pertussis]CFN23501.1 Uncharacterised protein [Bordetella pertussis]